VCKGKRRKERRQGASHPNQNQTSQESLQTGPHKGEAIVQKKSNCLKEARRRGFNRVFRTLVNSMCLAKNEELLTNKNQVVARWKEHSEEHLNEGSELEQPTRPVDLRDDGVDIDLPSREEIEILEIFEKCKPRILDDTNE
jgi:hypothetical protein